MAGTTDISTAPTSILASAELLTDFARLSLRRQMPGLVPHERIGYTSAFDDKCLPSEMTTAITLKAVSAGIELRAVQEGIPVVIPVDQCDLGSQVLLGQLVETEIRE